jgi:pyridoxal phosphate enzyme (YggS family)
MEIESNLAQIRRNIEAACVRTGRNPSEILLLPVSKGHSADEVRAAADLGLNIFGENKVQEARAKISQCPGRLRWHMIGHLQSNKCRDAVHFFQMIESVDSLDLAAELNKAAEKSARHIPILLEVNVAGEGTKFGFKPEEVLELIESINSLSRLEIHGLMTIAPYSNDAEKVRPVFKRLRELKDQCSQKLGAPLPHLSMGMSGDYQVAIEEGATIIRIGTALFGPRVYQKRGTGDDAP